MNNSVAVFILALLLTSVLFALVSGDDDSGGDGCDGFFNSTFTELNFSNAKVGTNELHLGGNLTYEGIGVVADKNIDLVITVSSGDYSDIADVWITEKGLKANESLNGLNDKFGSINLQNVPDFPKSGEGNFQACMVNSENYTDYVEVERFSFSVFDLDKRGDDKTRTKNNGQTWIQYAVTEMFVIDTAQAQSIQLDSNFANGIKIDCEDDGVIPIGNSNSCPSGRTIYRATKPGIPGDNPRDPNGLLPTQLERSVVVNFVNTSCFNFTFDLYCPTDVGYERAGEATFFPPNKCQNKRQGGYLLFAGRQEQIIQNGTCITKSPTDMPSDQPSASLSPSNEPSQLPSKLPSTIPSTSPSNEPSQLPSKLPSTIPSTSPSKEPSEIPSKAPSKAPSDIPSTSPSKEPSQLPSKAPSKAPSDIPSSSPSESQCPLDISLYSIDGNTPVDLLDAIRILDQNTTHVTVRLFQVWDAEGTVENIYFTYRNGPFKEICDEGTNVNGTDVDGPSFYKDFTIKCYSTRPVTLVGLCVADSGGALNSTLDNATIPANCCGGISQSTPAVCYKVVIQCDTLCVDAAALRNDCSAEARTETPTQSPTEAPTETPTEAPTQSPTETPTQSPTEAPTEAPTETPTQSPTGEPCCSDDYKTCKSQNNAFCNRNKQNCERQCSGVWLSDGARTGCLAEWAACEIATQWDSSGNPTVMTVQGVCCPGMACTGGTSSYKQCDPTRRRLADDNTGTEDEEDLEATFPDAPKTPQVLETIE